jgi:hypothetical protein
MDAPDVIEIRDGKAISPPATLSAQARARFAAAIEATQEAESREGYAVDDCIQLDGRVSAKLGPNRAGALDVAFIARHVDNATQRSGCRPAQAPRRAAARVQNWSKLALYGALWRAGPKRENPAVSRVFG